MTLCIVEEGKVRDYLLNLDHQGGAPKARFFLAGGFKREDTASLIAALQRHYCDNPPTKIVTDNFGGIRIIIDAPMLVPDGRTPMVRTVWKIDQGDTLPRLITAYPGE